MNPTLCSRVGDSSSRTARIISVIAAWTVAIFAATVLTAGAQPRGSEQLVTDPEQVKRILAALDDGLWIADGPASETHVYVIYSTACGFSKKLYGDTRALQNRPQFRWVTFAAEGYGAEMVVTKRTVESVGEAFAGKQAPPTDVAAANLAMSINRSIYLALPKSSNLVYPTLIYKTAQGLKITHGAPADLKTLTANVQSRPDRATYQPASLNWVSKPAAIAQANRLREYFNSSAAPVPMRIAPYPDAPVLTEVVKDYGFKVDGVANTEWIRVIGSNIEKSKVYGYIHAPLQIKLANLEFAVQPASGVVQSGGSGLEVRSHPSLDAPVLEKLGPGLQIKKSGEVMVDGRGWTEVIIYSDGTKGYVTK